MGCSGYWGDYDLKIAGEELGIAADRDGTEMPQIERSDRFGFEALCYGHDHAVGQAESKRLILGRNPLGPEQVRLRAPLYREAALRKISQKSLLDSRAKLGGRQIVDLRENRPWEDPLLWRRLEEPSKLTVVDFLPVEQSDNGARIGHDHDRPIPSRSSSAFVPRSDRRLRPAPRLRGERFGACRLAYSATASRTSAAAERRVRDASTWSLR